MKTYITSFSKIFIEQLKIFVTSPYSHLEKNEMVEISMQLGLVQGIMSQLTAY